MSKNKVIASIIAFSFTAAPLLAIAAIVNECTFVNLAIRFKNFAIAIVGIFAVLSLKLLDRRKE